MRILILGGNSKRHYDWIRQLGAYLVADGHEVILHDYRHWATGEEWADVEYELSQLTELTKDEKDYAVVAKSIGTVITVLGVQRGVLHPAKCMLLGIPLAGAVESVPSFDDYMKSLPQTVVMQNENDPYGSAEVAAHHIEAVGNPDISLLVTPGDTHDYTDFALIERTLG